MAASRALLLLQLESDELVLQEHTRPTTGTLRRVCRRRREMIARNGEGVTDNERVYRKRDLDVIDRW